ncbi:MAG: 3-phosphoglycerate dehydrogenase family protein [Clostridiales bacterium]|nr:3-phosphoglycerate dehydrogenase family protein [Clostridiales bacterium]
MFKIATLNKISSEGTNLLTDNYSITDDLQTANAILVRSANMLEMEFSDELLAIARAGAGTNNIPLEKCAEKGIVVFNTPGANANAVKELVIASILIGSRNLIEAVEWGKTLKEGVADAVEKGKAQFAGHEIKGMTLGVVGLGFIGVLVANAAERLGMRVAGYDPYLSVNAAHDLSSKVKIFERLEAMLPACDYVTIHVPAMKETKGMFNEELLKTMKSDAVLLNFSRDTLVVAADVKKALAEKKLRLYITDFPTDEMAGALGTILIPHLGASTEESEENCAAMAVNEVMNYLEDGVIENSVNYPTVLAGKKATEGPRLCVLHRNIPNILSRLTGTVGDMGINISNLVNKSTKDYACTILDLDSAADENAIRKAFTFDGVIAVRILK